jgi:hypothetical protein
MTTEITRLDHPIEAMYLIHKALQAEGRRVVEMVRQFEIGGSLQSIKAAFNLWAAALLFHADQEDRYMTAPLVKFQPARDNEAEHAALGKMMDDLATFLGRDDTKGLAERLKEVILVLHGQQHAELLDKLEDVMVVLNEEIGKTRVIARTQRHLYGRVVALLIAQNDHLETEEAFILPEVGQRFGEEEQLALVRQLLIDEGAEDQHWVLDWMTQSLTPAERQVLAEVEARFQRTSVPVD